MSESMRFEDILKQEIRWPKDGDKAFVQAADWENNALAVKDERARLVMMTIGYKTAADLMVKRGIDNEWDRHALVYPIVFNYRHFIELSLKAIIATYGHTVGVEANWKTHRLEQLWRLFRDVLQGYGVQDHEEFESSVARIIAEFAKVDPNSFSYRYPVDKAGKIVPISHDALDIDALAVVMHALESYFGGCDAYLDHLQNAGP